MSENSDRRQLTVMGRLKQKPIVKTDKNDKQYAQLDIAVDQFDQDTGEQLPTQWYNVAAYGEGFWSACGAGARIGPACLPRICLRAVQPPLRGRL